MVEEEEEMEIEVEVMEVVNDLILLHINFLHIHQIEINKTNFFHHRLKTSRLRDQLVKSVVRLAILLLISIIGWIMHFKESILLQN